MSTKSYRKTALILGVVAVASLAANVFQHKALQKSSIENFKLTVQNDYLTKRKALATATSNAFAKQLVMQRPVLEQHQQMTENAAVLTYWKKELGIEN